MCPALVTIVPMLAAAMLVAAGGERLARREVEHRTPADRERLFDLAEALRDELERLDSLYENHLGDLAELALLDKTSAAEAKAEALAGIRLIRVFRPRGSQASIAPSRPIDAPRLPEIELAGRKRPLDEASAVILDADWLADLPADREWLKTSDGNLRLRLVQPQPGVLVAILVEIPVVRARVEKHLAEWLEEPVTPLREARERVLVEPTEGPPLATVGPARHGPAAAIIPMRSSFSDWQIRAWDGLEIEQAHDPVVLVAAGMLACLLLGSGILLWDQQRRALRLAAQRVSFVNRVSHELGNPLTNLSLNLDLATEALTSDPAEARRRLGHVGEEIERLGRLVANVLTFSRRERDSLQLKPHACHPAEVITRTLENFRPALARRGVSIEAKVGTRRRALLDPDALSQITGNLLSNVEKYAAGGGWLGLECRQTRGSLVLEIRDRGPGIPAEARERIFRPFERVTDSINEGSSGTGLGLAIARELAARMGGSLELVDTPVGATFRLCVPAPEVLALVEDETHAA